MSVEDQIKHHLLKGGVEWHPLKDFFRDRYQSCVDGRSSRPLIGTPGGDMGTLLLMIVAAEHVLDRQFSSFEIKQMFYQYVDQFGLFYMHTDEHALHHLAKDFENEPEFGIHFQDLAEEEKVDVVRRLITKPLNAEQRKLFLEYLVKSENIGCGHLKLVSKHAKEYQVRLQILHTLIKAFYVETWHWGKTDFMVLEGGHAESLILNVDIESNEKLHENTFVPAVAPLNTKTSKQKQLDEFFINHPRIVEAIYRHNAITLVGKNLIPGITPLRLEVFLERVKELGGLQLAATLKYLAPELDVLNVELSRLTSGKTKIVSLYK